ncbi:MAG: hypothetical protein GF404_04940 [candidate division Zixibacteria bacterium]|jgi:rubrerythrin|nr:hypothetical protein [candidate division Zixibacteria bacterium]
MAAVSQAVLDGLNQGIQAELASYVFYKKSMDVTDRDDLKDLLAQLASEEKSHYKILERQYDSLVRSEMWVTYNDTMKEPGLPNLDEKMEDVHEDFIDEISSQITPKRILDIALSLEIRARDLYAGLAKQIDDPSGKETMEYLSKFEDTHVRKIKKLQEEVLK